MRLSERLVRLSEGKKTCEIVGCSPKTLHFQRMGFCPHPELLQKEIEFPWLGTAVSCLRDVWRSRNPSSALSLSSAQRWRTVIRFLSPFLLLQGLYSILHAGIPYLQHTHTRTDGRTRAHTDRRTFPHCCRSPPNPVYVQNERGKKQRRTRAQLRNSLEFPTLLAAVELYIQ